MLHYSTAPYGSAKHIFGDDDEVQAMIKWMQTRIKLKGFNDISKLWKEDDHTPIVSAFLNNVSYRSMFATVDRTQEDDNKLVLSLNSPPDQSLGRIDVAFFIREEGSSLTLSNIDDSLLFGTFAMRQTASSILDIMENIFYPNIFHTTDWNESSKQELTGLYHRFMAALTESANEETGRTMLYLPFKEGMTPELGSNVIGKDLVQQLEGIAIHWTRQVKGLLSSHEHELSSKSQGPIEEIIYWKSRAHNLSNILDQLQSKEVQTIVMLLKRHESKYVQPIATLKNSIQLGLQEAQNVVKFLSILQEPCERLSQLEPGSIPSIFLDLMNCTRLIYTHSSNYNTFDRVSDLLRRISSEIIRQCSTHISLNKMFYGEAKDVERVLIQSIQCGQQWKSLYNRAAVTINNISRAELRKDTESGLWHLDDESIFAGMDAFSQRCENLIDICKSKYQFVCHLCGYGEQQVSASEVAKRLLGGLIRPDVQKAIDGISLIFANEMYRLDHLNYDILDATNSRWHDDFKNFKLAMKDLDTMLVNIINKAFDGVQVVQTAVGLLSSFRQLAIRPAIKMCVQAKAAEVRMLFKRQCQSIRQEFDDFHRNPPLRMNEPAFAGAALWAQAMSNYIEDDWVLVKDNSINDKKEFDELSTLVENLKLALLSYQNKKYATWVATLAELDPSSVQDLLNRCLIRKVENPSRGNVPSAIAMNFDTNIITIFVEAQFWDKLHNDDFIVPSTILGICHQRESLRLLRERVLVLVRAFNDLLEDLVGIYDLFGDCLKRLEKKLRPGFSKLTWTTRQIIIERFVQNSVDEVKKIHGEVKSFHDRMKLVRTHCSLMSSMKLLKLDKNSVYRGKDFEKQQAQQRDEMKNICVSHYENIKQELTALHQHFRNGTSDVKSAWNEYISNIDTMICGSLLRSVALSLHILADVVSGRFHAGESHSIFTVEVYLKNGNILCRPSMIEITSSINQIAKELIGITKAINRLSTNSLEESNSQSSFQGTFFDEISSNRSILDSVVEIMQGTGTCVASIGEKILRWEKYRSLWDMDKESFVRRYSKTQEKSFEQEIEHYQNVESLVKRENSSAFLRFIHLNFSSIKTAVMSHSKEFQEKLLSLLKRNTINEISSLMQYFDANIMKLENPITTIQSLCEISQLLQQIDERSNSIANCFEPLEKAYKTLYTIDKSRIDPSEEDLLKKLRPRFQDLLNESIKSKSKLEKAKIIIKSNFQTTVSNHKDQMRIICKQVDDMLMTHSDIPDEEIIEWTESMLSDIIAYQSNEMDLWQGLNFFGMGFPDSDILKNIEKEVESMKLVVNNTIHWRVTLNSWLQTKLTKLDIDDMEEKCRRITNQVTNVCRRIKNWKYWNDFMEKLKLFQDTSPIIKCLLCEGMRERHWMDIGEIVNRNVSGVFEQLTLNDVYSLGLQRHLNVVTEIASRASKELDAEKILTAIKERLYEAKFHFHSYHETFKIVSLDKLSAVIEDDYLLLQSIKSSASGSIFEIQIESLESKFSIISEFLDTFRVLQHQWLYLEKIFVGSESDINEKLRNEANLFSKLNKEFKIAMAEFHSKEYLVAICEIPLIKRMEAMTNRMEEIQKSLDLYLESKRMMFPRFYFLSDDDLLELMGMSSEPELVKKHLNKCFEGVESLLTMERNVETDCKIVCGVRSKDNETIEFANQVEIRGPIEIWLQNVLMEMQESLAILLQRCVTSMKTTKRDDWIKDWQGQLLLTASSIAWTKSCERSLETMHSGKEKHLLLVHHKKQISHLNRLIKLVRELQQESTNRAKVVTIITAEVYKRDVIEMLMKNCCQSPKDFSWYSQLRFYLHKSDSQDSESCIIRQTFCTLHYGYEYQGNNGRLVVTPLTDRAILSLVTAKCLHRGGNPMGPAGSGKSATVKDLSKNLAYFCIVVNCSEEMDFKSIGQILAGLAQSGCWGCFDEFNRIKVDVLSVAAVQISTILNTIQCSQSSCNFLGSNIKIDAQCGIFVTMNPDYVGRSQLPDNLKVLLRPIAMMSPDFHLIVEVVLSAEGFIDARTLAKKVVTLYNLMREQFSSQSHYDYGLRSIKCVLVMAGTLIRSVTSDVNEEIILVRAIRCMNEPKFPNEDLQLFNLFLCDLFPNCCSDVNNNDELQDTIKSKLKANGLQDTDFIIQKTVQLADSMMARQSNMLIGPPLCWKSTIWQTLCSARQSLDQNCQLHASSINTFVINPKALKPEELFGSYNAISREWADGVLSSIFKACSESTKSEALQWIILDGPVDPLWIESMNSVMDDNKILTLANGDRIPLTQSMSLLFEVENLNYASPATVSRAGMIFVDNLDGWKVILSNWLSRRKKMFGQNNYLSLLEELCDKHMEPLLKFRNLHCKDSMKLPDSVVIKNFMNICDAFIFNTNYESNTVENCENWFFFCAVWAVGGVLNDKERILLDQFAKEEDQYFLPARSIFDYYIDPKTNEYELWESKYPKITTLSDSYHHFTVPTKDTIRYSFLMNTLISEGYRVLLMGDKASGKTQVITSVLRNAQSRSLSSAIINLTSGVESPQLQAMISDNLETYAKGQIGPVSRGTKLVIFMDDFSIPKPASDSNPYKPPLELIRHFICHGGWYDRKRCIWQNVVDTDIVAAMRLPAAGEEPIPNRLQSQFYTINYSEPNQHTVVSIFQAILDLGLKSIDNEIKSVFGSIAKAVYTIYMKCKSVFLPTPNKPHYDFSLRDVYRVAQGMLLASEVSIDSKAAFFKLFSHECLRSFSDKLIRDIDCDDRVKFSSILTDTMQYLVYSNKQPLQSEEPFFTGVHTESKNPGMKIYMQLEDKSMLYDAVNMKLLHYNNENPDMKMDLVLFDDVLKHLCRIHRILQIERGHMLFMGINGSGRESITRLSAFIANVTFFTTRMQGNHDIDKFLEDIKSLCIACGVKNKAYLLFLKEEQLYDSLCLEYVSNLLVSGSLQGLFSKEEKDKICDEIMDDVIMTADNYVESKHVLWEFFVGRTRKNLHLVFAASPLSHTLNERRKAHRPLFDHIHINWFHKWPKSALVQVAKRFLLNDTPDLKVDTSIADSFACIHDNVVLASSNLKSNVFFASSSYFELMYNFRNMFKENQKKLDEQEKKFTVGLEKLGESDITVQSMKVKLSQMHEKVMKSQNDCERMLEIIVTKQRATEQQRELVVQNSIRIEKEEKQCTTIAEEAEQDLIIALPALEAALAEVEKLDKSAITEIKVYSNPPAAVEKVLSCVMLLLGKPQDWTSSKRTLGESNFLLNLKSFDKDNVSESILAKVKKIIKSPSFAAEEVGKVSRAARALCTWCHAIYRYAYIYKKVKPKRDRLNVAKKELSRKRDDLFEIQHDLEDAAKKLDDLRKEYDHNICKKNQLKSEAASLEKKLNRAEKLLGGFKNEHARWRINIAKIKSERETSIGDIIVCAAFLSYAGPFDSFYREKLISFWIECVNSMGMNTQTNLKVCRYLSSDVQAMEWNLQGLPKDDFSIENAIIATKSRKWPLLIDPQGQGLAWIRAKEADSLKLLKDGVEKGYWREFETAVLLGHCVLFTITSEKHDPMLDPILYKQISSKSTVDHFVRFGQKNIRYSENFRLYLQTYMPVPCFSPELVANTKIINFSVTQNGLEEQLLAVLLKEEEPELERQRSAVVTKLAYCQCKLNDLEDKILSDLSRSSGSFIEDSSLVNAIQESIATADDINNQVEIAKDTGKKLENHRETFRSVAKRSSSLFFTLQDLSAIDHMYQFSLESYLSRFQFNITQSITDCSEETCHGSHNNRVETIIKYHTLDVWSLTRMGLFEKHKMLFTLQLCIRIMNEREEIPKIETEFFSLGKSFSRGAIQSILSFSWLSEKQNEALIHLNCVIDGVLDCVKDNEDEWERWYKSQRPEMVSLPANYDCKLTEFQKLCILRVFRIDRIPYALNEFISLTLGEEFTIPPVLDLKMIVGKNPAKCPIVFILSPGADPTDQITKLSKSFTTQLRQVALGQGQAATAIDAINTATLNGSWVLLSNCHLMLSWMKQLEHIIDSCCQSDNIHEGYRLWLTSNPTIHFPMKILQCGLKIVDEAPRGLRANLNRLCDFIPSDILDKPHQNAKKRVIISLMWLHSLLHERRKFKNQGFNIPYDFNTSDFMVSCDLIMKTFFQHHCDVSLNGLQHLIGEAIYGGKVIDEWDMRLLRVYLQELLSEDILKQDRLQPFELQEYCIKFDVTLQTFKSFISALPTMDNPALFGQHPNSEISSQAQEVNDFLSNLSKMEIMSEVTTIHSREHKEFNPHISAVLEKIPDPFNEDQLKKLNTELDPNDAVRIFLKQEVYAYNSMLKIIFRTKEDISEFTVKGSTSPSKQLKLIINDLVQLRVPMEWSKYYDSTKPLDSWVNDLCMRIEQLTKWIEEGEPNVVWLGGFLRPSSFLTSVLQIHSRIKFTSAFEMDTKTSWEFQVLKKDTDISTKPDGGMYIAGMFLEGAMWEEDDCDGHLVEQIPMQPQSPMPIIHFKPSDSSSCRKRSGNEEEVYHCPVYSYPGRRMSSLNSSYVLAIDLNCGGKSASHWTKRGVALLLSTTY